MRRWGLAGLALALLLGGVLADEKKVDKEKAVKEEWGRLNGTWETGRAVMDGKEAPAPKGGWTSTFKDGKFTFKRGGKVVTEGTAKVDPTTSPRSLDLIPGPGPDEGEIALAIYELKGDTLRFCFAEPGQSRPKAFESKKGSRHALVTYKRVKARD